MLIGARDPRARRHHADEPRTTVASDRRHFATILVGSVGAVTDGPFIAREIGGGDVDLIALFDLHARTLIDIVTHQLTEHPAQQPAPRTGTDAPNEGRGRAADLAPDPADRPLL